MISLVFSKQASISGLSTYTAEAEIFVEDLFPLLSMEI